MSYAGSYLKRGISLFNALDEGKPHSSITDWVEVLSSDRYDELSLDGIHELVESVNIQGHFGTKVCPCLSRVAAALSLDGTRDNWEERELGLWLMSL